ncbi:hypothetical protein GCM10007385_44500 [Tateyamaria omphalii]|uniref:glycosyltransferase n=1 Tax=Tateyamaria omphalii TaxID=299262 RepID=UPI001678987A|nr:glycosyltransferase [Tateyamaria omphalii]GGX70557.1 hypothetical protein GCM10007385_44500 [Tateyamaria omphalii]
MTERHILLANVFFAPFTYGGATVVAEEVAKALLRRGGFRVSVVSLCAREELQTYTVVKSQRDGIVNYVINVPHGRSYAQLYSNPDVSEIVGSIMDDLQPDLLHAHCLQDMGVDVLEAAEARGIPSILSVHDFWWLCERQFMIRPEQTYCGQSPVNIEDCRGCVNDFDAAKARQDRLHDVGRLPARVTYPSAFARDLSVSSGFAPDHSVVWENGVRLPGDDFAEAQLARRAKDKRLTFGFLGGPSQIKGWPTMREAFKSLNREDFRVFVVDGSMDGSWWSNQSLSDLPGEWEVYPRFSQHQMDAFYAQIDVVLFMSQWKETFGLAIREALARGISIIQTDSGGTVEHGTVPESELIPIGAKPSVLAERLDAVLRAHPAFPEPVKVQSYDAQAEDFAALVETVLAERA